MQVGAPKTRYATAERNVHIAYQVFGGGSTDLVFVPPFVSNVDVWWELPIAARFFNRLGTFARVILLDKRGTGLSDRLSTMETPEERIDDIRAVMDAVGLKSAAIFGASEAVPIAILFAATYPERTNALLLWGGMARWSPDVDYPWSISDDLYAQIVDMASAQWGTGFSAQLIYPSGAADPGVRDWFCRYERASASPGGFARITLNNTALDVRAILPSIQARTLLLHATDDTFVHVGGSRYLAAQIPGAKYIERPGRDHMFCGENGDLLVEEIEEFLTGTRHRAEPNRVLATVLYMEILSVAGSDAKQDEVGWQDRIEQLLNGARKEIDRHRGAEVELSADRLIATFDGPARAVTCAEAILETAQKLALQARAGLHAGECARVAGKIGGLAMQVAAAVKDQAAPGEITVSSTVRDLVAGSGIVFEDQGKFKFPGTRAEWGVLVVLDRERALSRSTGSEPGRQAFEAAVDRAVGTPRTGPLSPLSKRESEVALLIAEGLTSRQIAIRLFLAERTVEWHVEQILSKLGFSNRAQVASWISQRTSSSGA